MKTFLTIWLGQLTSNLGSSLTGFALGVFIFLETESVTQFSMIWLCGMVPATLIAPFAGVWVDRLDRRRILIGADSISAVITLVLLFLLKADQLEVWHILVGTSVSAMSGAFQMPAFTASIQTLVDKDQYGRAAGLNQLSGGLGHLVGPPASGFLLASIGMVGIVTIDLVTFSLAVGTLLLVRIPRAQPSEEGQKDAGSMWGEMKVPWRFMRERPGLFGMVVFVTFMNLMLATSTVLLGPMVLSFSTPATMGVLFSMGGAGMLIGGLFMSIWGGPARKVNGLIGFSILAMLGIALLGFRPNPMLMGFGLGTFGFCMPVIMSCSQAIWLRKTPADIMGRVMSMRRMMISMVMPLGFLVSGPLADKVFEPMMAANGAGAQFFGPIIGVGPGRGMGLMLVCTGLIAASVAAISFFFPTLRNVESLVPDTDNPATPKMRMPGMRRRGEPGEDGGRRRVKMRRRAPGDNDPSAGDKATSVEGDGSLAGEQNP